MRLILPGMAPDPTICWAGGFYYLCVSSFEYFPGLPIYRSADLTHWELIGHIADSAALWCQSKPNPSEGFWAPVLRHHAGHWFASATDKTDRCHKLYHAECVEGPWELVAGIDFPGIDPDLFFDPVSGDCIFSTAGAGNGVMHVRIDPRTGRFLGDPWESWKGTGGRDPEGPHLHYREGWYYLLMAEGGTFYGHMATLARSRTLEGPYESCPHNPVLSHRDGGNGVEGLGHLDWVESPEGETWAVALGFRTVSDCYTTWHHLGRETFLFPVVWGADGWPVVGQGRRNDLETVSPPAVALKHRFCNEPRFLRPRDRERVATSEGDILMTGDEGAPVWLGAHLREFDWDQRIEVVATSLDCGVAEILVYRNPRHHAGLRVAFFSNRVEVCFFAVSAGL